MTESELIDFDTIHNLRTALEEGIFELFNEFISDGPRSMERLDTAVESMDIYKIGQAAHYLKGSAGNIGAIALFNACNTLEQHARNNDVDKIPGQFVELKQVYLATIKFMEKQRQEIV